MSVVYPEPAPNPAPPASAGARLWTFAENHIVLAGAMLLALALAVGYLVNKVRGGSSTSSSSTQQPQTLYVPTSNTFSTTTTTVNNPPPGPQQQFGTVRLAASDPNAPTFGADKNEAGIPILSQPTAVNFQQNELGLAPYGSQIQITGAAVQGGNNLQGAPGGTTTWYPVMFNGQQGYISAYDLSQGGGGFLAPGPGGVTPGTGSGADPFHDGHASPMRSILSVNQGVSHYVNNVIGA